MTMLVRGGAVTGPALPATATTGQVLQWNGTAWVAATPSASGTTPNATPTVPGLVQLAGDLGGTATAPTVAKINGAAPAAVATTGKYTDLTGAPALSTVATTGSYADLTGRPALSTVATTGSYGDLTGRPLLATVATTGAYTDLTGAPAAPILRGKATATTTTSATAANDPDLQIASLPAGTYALEALLVNASGNTGNTAVTFATSAPTVQFVVNTGSATGNSINKVWNLPYTLTTPVMLTGFVVATAAGSFGVQTTASSAPNQSGLGPGTWMRLTKVA